MFLKSILILIFSFSFSFSIDNFQKYTDGLLIKNLKTNEIIVQYNEEKKIRPASLTKILTAIIAIESGHLNSKVLIEKEMIDVEPSILGLKVGDIVLLEDLVKAALISSSNDATKSISIFLGNGNNNIEKEQNFIKFMNLKAKKIGMKNSTFTNASGFDIENHFTTINDLMILSEYTIKNKKFNEFVKIKETKIKTLNNNNIYYSKTHNKLLYKNEEVIGIKTGYTKKAGPCLIARAKDNNKDFLIIMINSKVNRWDVANNIFNALL